MARWLLSSSPPIFDAFYFDCRWGLMSPSSAFVQTHSYKKLSFFFCSRWFWSLPLRFFLFILLRLIFDGRMTKVFYKLFFEFCLSMSFLCLSKWFHAKQNYIKSLIFHCIFERKFVLILQYLKWFWFVGNPSRDIICKKLIKKNLGLFFCVCTILI